MTANEKQEKEESDRVDESKQHSNGQPGTETAAKGGSDVAKHQAERDWQNSSKEEGD